MQQQDMVNIFGLFVNLVEEKMQCLFGDGVL